MSSKVTVYGPGESLPSASFGAGDVQHVGYPLPSERQSRRIAGRFKAGTEALTEAARFYHGLAALNGAVLAHDRTVETLRHAPDFFEADNEKRAIGFNETHKAYVASEASLQVAKWEAEAYLDKEYERIFGVKREK